MRHRLVTSDLEHFAPLAGIMARESTRARSDLYDDARQEALIAAWRERTEHPDAPASWAHRSARIAARDVARGRPMTGQPSHRGRQDAHDTSQPLEDQDPGGMDETDRIDSALVVRDVVASLDDDDRSLVYLRYWEDRPFAEASVILGVPAGTLSRRWVEKIRPRLRQELALAFTA